MNKYLLLIIIFCAGCGGYVCELCENPYNVTDGLPKPDHTEYFDISEGNGDVYGVHSIGTFYIDINNDGKKDKIKRGHFVTMTAHGYDFYEIELHNGKKLDLPGFRTIEAAECFLQFYHFQFEPEFQLTKISRPLGKESWTQLTPIKIEKFKIINDKLEKISTKSHKPMCDVRAVKF